MRKISFIHLSDIHFVKSSDNPADIDKDLRDAIITDLYANAKSALENVSGILVTGDIAFSGSNLEYEIAKKYLNEISDIFAINPSDIYCVPGNHDVNQVSVNTSHIISQEQSAIEAENTIDDADRVFFRSLNDPLFNNILFAPIREYNEFASRFNCHITPERLVWREDFDLGNEMKLRLFGINSCYISNSRDNQRDLPARKMYIGQAQIPPRIPNTAVLLMGHHPPDCWKFKDDIISKINKRADVQLYGHMHDQEISLSEHNVILYSGAAHPNRTSNWEPRYNWVSISTSISNGERLLDIEIYPRILSSDRDCFTVDRKNVTVGNCMSHSINIDAKRKLDLADTPIESESCSTDDRSKALEHKLFLQEEVPDTVINERELIYRFYELSVVRQMELLGQLELLTDDDKGKSLSVVLNDAIKRSIEQGKYQLLWDGINERIS